jgi:hypothetical protein
MGYNTPWHAIPIHEVKVEVSMLAQAEQKQRLYELTNYGEMM